MKLAACNGKRIADMTRDDLIEALEQMNNSYRAIARLQMGDELPVFNWSMEEADKRLAEIAQGAMSKACRNYGERVMQTIEIELREKIALLEEENIQLRKALMPLDNPFVKLDLTPQQRELLHAIYRADIATYDHLACVIDQWASLARADEAEGDAHLRLKVAVCKLRQRLKPYSVTVETVYSVGYFMSQSSKARLQEIIKGGYDA